MNAKLYLERAKNEMILAEIVLKMSICKELQKPFGTKAETFFSAAIGHSYYCIFYSAKAYLLSKGVRTKSPREHENTMEEFKKFVDAGILDVELLNIYKSMIVRADRLLGIFALEKGKRTEFTYYTIPQANQSPAEESVKNAEFFISSIKEIIKPK